MNLKKLDIFNTHLNVLLLPLNIECTLLRNKGAFYFS